MSHDSFSHVLEYVYSISGALELYPTFHLGAVNVLLGMLTRVS